MLNQRHCIWEERYDPHNFQSHLPFYLLWNRIQAVFIDPKCVINYIDMPFFHSNNEIDCPAQAYLFNCEKYPFIGLFDVPCIFTLSPQSSLIGFSVFFFLNLKSRMSCYQWAANRTHIHLFISGVVSVYRLAHTFFLLPLPGLLLHLCLSSLLSFLYPASFDSRKLLKFIPLFQFSSYFLVEKKKK